MLLLLVGVACGSTTPRPAPSHAAPSPAPSSTVEEVVEGEQEEDSELTACERHAAVSAAIDACTALTDEQRQDIESVRMGDLAATSESGLDGNEVDAEAQCERSLAHDLRVAKGACGL